MLQELSNMFFAADIAKNVERQRQLLGILDDKQAAFHSTFGFSEWRRACEVPLLGRPLPEMKYRLS